MPNERGEVLHSLLHLVTQIQDHSSVGMCPGPALLTKIPGEQALSALDQAEVIECVQELAKMDLVEFPSLGKSSPDKSLFLVRVTAAGKRALQAAPSSPFWKKSEPHSETAKLGRDPHILLHQTITMEQVLLALRAGVEQSNASEEDKEALRRSLARAQEAAQRSTETGAGPSLSQWARHNPAQLAVLLSQL
ncbi:MAG: hypothetical protein KF760_01145 [Candidatus Eremiobacteraeota bacterium]|nr:hypothetical protein [Candidatus Eremiobacteraeota bacterium]MCW5868069.1 hypothetical protein [Candidatus Eremiobacteraeota bacterium]